MSNEIEVGIFRSLEVVVQACLQPDAPGGGGMWTRSLKEALCRLGRSNGFKVAASGCNQATHGEWLFDLAWHRDQEGVPWSLRSTNFGDVAWDFEKLLVARCSTKRMVYQQRNEQGIAGIAERLCEMVGRYEPYQPSGRYLLAGYAFDERRFHFRIVEQRTEDGSVPMACWPRRAPANPGSIGTRFPILRDRNAGRTRA